MHGSRPCALSGGWHYSLFIAAVITACSSATSHSSEDDVRRIWDEYLASKNGQFEANAGRRSPIWSAAEQARWPLYDLAGFYLPDRAIPEVPTVTPVDVRIDSAYRIVTRFWPEGTPTRDSTARPDLTMTVYARREGSRWALANALPYNTSSWAHETLGRVTFHVAPGLQFDAMRATRTVAFVDSLAAAFNVAPPPRLDYYVTESVDQALGILGVVLPERFGAAGGFSKPVNLQVFSGIPELGEEYRHEVAHVVLLPIIRESGTSLIASEGVPTW